MPAMLRLLVLAPHPDDFDEVAVTLRHFSENGTDITLAVLTGGASGVLDSFVTPVTDARKVQVREAEQLAALSFFELPASKATFLRLPVQDDGELRIDDNARAAVARLIGAAAPDIVTLPYGDDTNAGHRRTYAAFRDIAKSAPLPLLAMYQSDPKTVEMRVDAYMPFGERAAQWKREMLRFHRSQHTRNLQQRGSGLDDRILQMNAEIAAQLACDARYAESFQLELFADDL